MIDDTDEVVLKIVLIGEAGVGKTSIISNFIDNRFDSNIQSSIGASFSSKTLSFKFGIFSGTVFVFNKRFLVFEKLSRVLLQLGQFFK